MVKEIPDGFVGVEFHWGAMDGTIAVLDQKLIGTPLIDQKTEACYRWTSNGVGTPYRLQYCGDGYIPPGDAIYVPFWENRG